MDSAGAREASVKREVAALLARSSAFRGLHPEAQAQFQRDLEKVSGFLADQDGLTAPRAEALEEKKPPDPVTVLKQQLAGPQETAGHRFTAGAVREGTEQFGELVKKVDFPKFVSGLVHGVFQAVVDASIQQMQAFSEMLAATAKTVDQFAKDHVTDAQARDYVANRYPGSVRVDTEGEGPARLRPREGEANADFDVGAQFGVPGADLTDDDAEQKLVDQAKMEMAKQRQQMLATMVLLGINRIVVTNGHINAKVVFDMKASDVAARHAQAQMADARHETSAQFASAAGGFGFFAAMGGEFSSSDHTATVSSAMDDTSESKAAVKAQLSGDVRLAFKSETFPLERMVDVLGLQQINQKAAPAPLPSGGRTARAPAPAPAPAPTPAPAAAPAGGAR
jgi:hypothetical protein